MPQINIADIFIDETFNSRDEITPFDVSDLMKSIADNGLLQPIIVSPWDKDGLKWRLVAGFRRTFACRFSEWVEIEAVIKEVKNEDEAIRLNLTENHVRSNLNILEEAKAIKRFKDRGMTQMATSNLLGKKNFSRGWVQVRFKLLELPPEIQQAAASGWLTGDDIKSLDGYTKEELFEQVKLLKESRQKAALGKGIRRKISKTSKNIETKKKRSDHDLAAMQTICQDTFGPGSETVLIGWMLGYSTTVTCFKYLARRAEQLEKTWNMDEEIWEKYLENVE